MTDLDSAALAVGRDPLSAEAHARLGIIHSRLGQFARAAAYCDRAIRLNAQSKLSAYDQGFLFSAAAVAYAAVDRVDDALAVITHVPREVRLSDAVRPMFMPCFKEVQKVAALQALLVLWETLVWNDEPLKALGLLRRCVPAMVDGTMDVAALRSLTESKLCIAFSWPEYKRCYDGLDSRAYDYHREDAPEVRTFGRMIKVREWAAAVPVAGPPFTILAIGPQDCILERDLLAMNPRFHVTVCDVSMLARGALSSLSDEFPGRVETWWVRQGYYDWPLGPFDAIVCLEVIEHLPDQERALNHLWCRLAAAGTILLSTPCAGCWTNPRLTREPESHSQWGHMHANSRESLARKITSCGLAGAVEVIDDGMFLFTTLTDAGGTDR